MKNRIQMLSHNGYWQMMSFIITTSDGKCIVVDGGYSDDADKLLSTLRRVTGSAKPHVDAWFLTHAHDDHINAFGALYESNAEDFTCGGVYYCFPSEQYIQKYEKGSEATLHRFNTLLPKFAHVAHTVSTGDVYCVGEAEFEILLTYDDTETQDVVNNSSTVMRMTLGGKTCLFLGDTGREQGARLLARYGKALKSDYCQMAHHGQDGAREDVYQAIAPQFCFWCAPEWLWNNDRHGTGYDTDIFETVRTREWMAKQAVKEHYVMLDRDIAVEL